jgi:hypothetical protein
VVLVDDVIHLQYAARRGKLARAKHPRGPAFSNAAVIGRKDLSRGLLSTFYSPTAATQTHQRR